MLFISRNSLDILISRMILLLTSLTSGASELAAIKIICWLNMWTFSVISKKRTLENHAYSAMIIGFKGIYKIWVLMYKKLIGSRWTKLVYNVPCTEKKMSSFFFGFLKTHCGIYMTCVQTNLVTRTRRVAMIWPLWWHVDLSTTSLRVTWPAHRCCHGEEGRLQTR